MLAVCITALFIVGLTMITIGPSQRGGAAYVVIGVMLLLVSLWFGAITTTNRLIVNAAGLVYWHNLRKSLIGWPEIQSFGVGPSRSAGRYPCPIVYLKEGKITVTSLASFTGKRPARIVGELTAFQRDLRPADSLPDKSG
jgi:hypothetical protein